MAQRRIAIIGSGFSGLCLGIQLKKAGIDAFTIFEKSDRLGGTWRDNTYPGAACDVPSSLYCFSFEQKTDWSRLWSPQEEIRDYMEHCARKYDLVRHLRFGTEIAGARFDAGAGVWRLRTTGGEEIVADVLVSAVGQLNRPAIPAIPGLDRFRGACFHSARFDHGADLAGKRVGVIGNAASAIQLIPQIAPRVRHLSIFQRSANWMLPRGDRAYTERERRWLARFPLFAWLHRWSIWLRLELRFPIMRKNRFFAWMARRAAEKNLRAQVPEPLPDVRPQHQPRPQLDHLHDRVPDALHPRRDPHLDRARPRLPRPLTLGDGGRRRAHAGGARRHGLGGHGQELVQDREGTHHQQLVWEHRALLVDHAALRWRALSGPGA